MLETVTARAAQDLLDVERFVLDAPNAPPLRVPEAAPAG
jgi:hypothetical protein